MLQDLKTILCGIMPKERVALIEEAIDELEDVNFVNGAGEVYQLWSGSFMDTMAKAIDETELILKKAHIALLTRYGITLTTDQLPILVQFNKRIRFISESIEHDVYLEILDREDDAVSTLAELLAVPFGELWTKHIESIATVNDAFIERVTELHTKSEDEYVEPYDPAFLKRFVSIHKNTVGEKAIRELGLPPCTEMSVVISQYKAYLQSLLPNHLAVAATEFVSIAVLAGHPYARIVEVATNAANGFYMDPDFSLRFLPEAAKVLNMVPMNG